MIISSARKIRTADPAAFAWSTLRKFQNSDLIADELMSLHKVEHRWRDDVRKQAQQIRYCMVQAREYFTAAKSVSLATKPNLLYYGTMSLALAEILFKQTGDSSLDRARSEHRHHGLSMTAGAIPRNANLAISSQALRASPITIDGARKGTFELWHRSSREHPLAGSLKTYFEGSRSTTGYDLLMAAIDEPYRKIPDEGVTLLECLQSLPLLFDHVASAGLAPQFVRGKTDAELWPGQEWKSTTTVVFHPGPLTATLTDRLRVNPNSVNMIEVYEVGTGVAVRLQNDWINGHASIPLPPAATISTNEWRMWTNDPPLNEFGYLYAALFIAGNYARYFPDKWLLDVERSTPLALAIEELCGMAEWRAPWLALCELGMNLLVNED